MGFDKEDSYYSMKHQMKKKSAIFCNKVNRKITWSSSCWKTLSIISKTEKRRIGEKIKDNYLSSKICRNPNVADTTSVTIERPTTSHKLPKTIRQSKKLSQIVGVSKNSDSSLYSERTKHESFLDKKMQN